MNLFYNPVGVGDVLLIQFSSTNPTTITVSREQDIAWLADEETGEVVGANLFKASTYLPIKGEGNIEVTSEVVDQLQKAIHANGSDYMMDIDLSPKFVVGKVLTKEKHPNADRLSVCTVDVGEETLQIVCGAPNVEADQNVVVAKVGAVMPSGLVIRDAELRGVPSSGMICSAKELALPNAPSEKGILVLNSDEKPGTPYLLS
ncbi:YtpR family tRNA-binding protein [Sporosarcina sp. 179-K 3D1 HS]|uniref:YtpR family tRNA-binding protein n=1 Tax=Sporosarcina sp. 179-K 3D1 HS TaxID=3232169 RepID=UPI0039A0422E